MEAMVAEMQAAAAQADKAKAKADLDALQAKYQAEVDAFAEAVNTFATSQAAPAEQVAMAMQRIKGIPLQARTEIEQAAAAPAAATPAQPQ